MKHTRHGWLMILGCLVPLAALGAIFLFNIPVSRVVVAGFFLLCPLLHLWMMRSGHAHGEEAPSHPSSTLAPDEAGAPLDRNYLP